MITIMVVDDEEGVRRSLRRILEGDGYHVLLAADGQEAIHMVATNGQTIETVISDFKMPGIDGLQTLIAIGKLNPEITRIILTGYATMDTAIYALNAGIDGFLTKPFDNTELKLKVREYNLRKRLKQFVPEQVYDYLQKERQHLLPRRQRVTVLFSDIRGFSAIAEKSEPESLAEMVNHHYFSPLDNVIFAFEGTLDKHIGDSIMAVFGAPLAREDDTLRAVLCALKMREEMEKGNNRQFTIGIGISTGEVMAGVFGSIRKKEYTVFGHPVNLAARLERIAQGGEILICEETYRHVADKILAEAREIPNLKGVGRKIQVFNVVGTR